MPNIRKTTGALAFLCASLFSQAQDFSGYRNSNYAGVNSVFFNPANIADSRYKFDVNLFGVSGFVGNNSASFSLKNLTNAFNGDSIKNQLFGEAAKKSNGFVSTIVNGPSLQFNLGKKNTIALTSRAKIMANVQDMDGKLVSKITNGFSPDASLPYTVSSSEDMRFTANGWTEFGVSLARVLRSEGNHFLKGGVTLKLLSGAGNGYMNIANFNGSMDADFIRQDVYLYNTTGRIAVGFGGVRLSNPRAVDVLKLKNTGFGADVGFVYEFRPEKSSRQENPYKLKVGVAVLDLGKISYSRDLKRSGAYDINITGNKRLYFGELDSIKIDDYKAFFNKRPQYFTPVNSNNESSYSVALPSTLQLDVDYHLQKNFYVSLAGQFAITNNSKIFNTYYHNTFTLTPRYEGRKIGVYIPVNYNALTKMNAGASFRFGPLFLGSGSVLSALFGDSRQVDVHVGVRFGFLK